MSRAVHSCKRRAASSVKTTDFNKVHPSPHTPTNKDSYHSPPDRLPAGGHRSTDYIACTVCVVCVS